MKMPVMRQVARDGAGMCVFLCSRKGGDGEKLFVMTYNVLAQCYIRSSFFPYCKPSVLRWKNRSKQLEVDQYNEFWVGMMAGLGYNGYERHRMRSYPWPSQRLCVLAPSRGAERGSVGVVAHFQHLETPLEFVVTTTHLFWDPAQEDVKLLQTRRMLLAVDAFTSAMNASTPTIFAGDFNSLPDSKVYQFITDNKHFRSAYVRYDHDGEPAFTNVNGATETEDKKQVPSFVGTLDYIFYRSARYTRLCSGCFPGLWRHTNLLAVDIECNRQR
ncbi:hypothetical protein BBJ28_00022050 [Nothophytophthora sp. Chile5]|nr:hypothetical protein BBJ28_00022050 [Nothophytophthora sp. Chile5]